MKSISKPVLEKKDKRGRIEEIYRSQAILAQANVLPISSSALRFEALVLDCASKELASSINSGGKSPEWRGITLLSACSIDLFIVFAFACLLQCSKKEV